MKTVKRFALLLLLLSRTAPSSAEEKTDSTAHRRTHSIEEVVVTGARAETDIRHLPMSVSIIDRSQIEQSLQPSLLPLLTEQIPGLFVTARGVMGYGVSGGAAGAISLRGLSGGSGQLMVLIDGHPQYMGLMGHPIADAYQSLMAEKVEVLRGPASVLYGSNAMGGVINIVTRKMDDRGVKTDAQIGYGSYNTLQTEVSNRIRAGRFSSILTASYDRTDGHRSNMDFEQYGGYAKLAYQLSRTWKARADLDITHFNASQPGTVDAPLEDADQRITRGMTSAAIENDYGTTSGALSFFFNWGRHKINDGYTVDPSDSDDPKLYRFRSHDRMLGISCYQSASLFEGNRLTAGVDWYRFGGDKGNYYILGDRAGEAADPLEKTMHEVAGYLDIRQHIGSWLTIGAGVRLDHHSHVGTEWIPQAGLSFHLPRSAEIKLSAAKGFRYPTLREMYMFPPQNPDLRPESMWCYEIAVSQNLLDGHLSYGVNLFYIDGKDLIIAVPRPGATPLNMNTGEIDNAGVEAQVAWRISAEWNLEANYSFLHMRKPVLGAPEHKLYAAATFVRKRWTVGSGLLAVDGLYI
ncbi:MAG: TonB-dependent receptor, partial [Alistipes sp.]|nr:TonB-dependent receptor [Alistipes sp.]